MPVWLPDVTSTVCVFSTGAHAIHVLWNMWNVFVVFRVSVGLFCCSIVLPYCLSSR